MNELNFDYQDQVAWYEVQLRTKGGWSVLNSEDTYERAEIHRLAAQAVRPDDEFRTVRRRGLVD